jgi:hypothetical protein
VEVLVRTAMTAVAAGAVACAAVSGCTINIGNRIPPSTATVSKEDLQKDISQRLADAVQTPQSVSCPADLLGQPGQSTRCEVTMSATSSFEPIVTVTSVEGTKVNYDITPAVSKSLSCRKEAVGASKALMPIQVWLTDGRSGHRQEHLQFQSVDVEAAAAFGVAFRRGGETFISRLVRAFGGGVLTPHLAAGGAAGVVAVQ